MYSFLRTGARSVSNGFQTPSDISIFYDRPHGYVKFEILIKLCDELEYTDEHATYFDETFKEDDEDSRPF